MEPPNPREEGRPRVGRRPVQEGSPLFVREKWYGVVLPTPGPRGAPCCPVLSFVLRHRAMVQIIFPPRDAPRSSGGTGGLAAPTPAVSPRWGGGGAGPAQSWTRSSGAAKACGGR